MMQIRYHDVLLRLALAAFVLASLATAAHAAQTDPADADVQVWTDGKIAAWLPTAAERRFDEIGWADSLTAAGTLSAESGRPVFLFTLDGQIGIGRC